MKSKDWDPLTRVVERLANHLDNAACVAIMLNLDRDLFLELAAKSIDRNLKWHRDFVDEDEREKKLKDMEEK